MDEIGKGIDQRGEGFVEISGLVYKTITYHLQAFFILIPG
jgi:hypothetical protein